MITHLKHIEHLPIGGNQSYILDRGLSMVDQRVINVGVACATKVRFHRRAMMVPWHGCFILHLVFHFSFFFPHCLGVTNIDQSFATNLGLGREVQSQPRHVINPNI